MSEQPRPARFPKQARLLKSAEFDAVFAAKQSAADGRLVLYVLANDLDHPRLGLVVSRKVGNAVVRNRWKRTLREAFRLSQHQLPPLDMVVLPRGRFTPTMAPLQESLLRLASKAARRDKPRKRQA